MKSATFLIWKCIHHEIRKFLVLKANEQSRLTELVWLFFFQLFFFNFLGLLIVLTKEIMDKGFNFTFDVNKYQHFPYDNWRMDLLDGMNSELSLLFIMHVGLCELLDESDRGNCGGMGLSN